MFDMFHMLRVTKGILVVIGEREDSFFCLPRTKDACFYIVMIICKVTEYCVENKLFSSIKLEE